MFHCLSPTSNDILILPTFSTLSPSIEHSKPSMTYIRQHYKLVSISPSTSYMPSMPIH